jgi:hypothetical protein
MSAETALGNLILKICSFSIKSTKGLPMSDSTPAIRIYVTIDLKYHNMKPMMATPIAINKYFSFPFIVKL